MKKNALYYGDNLSVLRNEIPDESVDLIYLDPPFNSSATYNLLFRSPKGQESQAQIEAFEDTIAALLDGMQAASDPAEQERLLEAAKDAHSALERLRRAPRQRSP